jgi:hypothetical protein
LRSLCYNVIIKTKGDTKWQRKKKRKLVAIVSGMMVLIVAMKNPLSAKKLGMGHAPGGNPEEKSK